MSDNQWGMLEATKAINLNEELEKTRVNDQNKDERQEKVVCNVTLLTHFVTRSVN